MECHGYVPEDLLLRTVIPIPQNSRKHLYNSDHYRGIALKSTLGKVLGKAILLRNENVLFTFDLQFRFKRKRSTTQCSYITDEH